MINGGKEREYKKDFMKIKFDSDDNLPLGGILKLFMLTVVARSVFEEDGRYYPQIFQTNACMEKCCSMKELTFLKKLILIKQAN